MKTDRYTKTILTIIAICLVINVLDKIDLMPHAYANTTATPALPPAPNYGLVPLNPDGSISVTLKNAETIDVNIRGINTFDELDVNIDEVGGYGTYGEIPVKIKE